MTTIIRFILTSILCFLIYKETGVFTTIAIALIFLNSEIVGFIIKIHGEAIKQLLK